MSLDLLKAVPIIHVTLSNMKKAVLHDGWSLSSPKYHHTDQYLTVNIDVLACMVSTSYLVQICRYAEMQICRYAPISQDQKWHTQSGVTDPSGFDCCPSVRLKSSLYIGCISWESVKNLNTTAQRFERSQTQKNIKTQKSIKILTGLDAPTNFLF